MKNICLSFFCVLLLAGQPQAGSDAPAGVADRWVVMPAGAHPTYMGIHGGTMPVSLLVSEDGTSLLTFVGRTGNDFLEILRRTYTPMPSLFNATAKSNARPLLRDNPMLVAGNTSGSMPVIHITGEKLTRSVVAAGQLQPFGLSEHPLAIEGTVAKPTSPSPSRRYRLFFQPQHLEPRRSVN